ncbi:MAG: DUF58 domain-containing protein [Ahrensia sp.]|nr:DUF58 domain-containing protein [Ahrensia sp.]
MAVSIGSTAETQTGPEVLARSRARAALIPDLLVEAQRIANSVTGGWHGRKRRGIGDTFWQFRPYDATEGTARIDWRRSAREDSLYVRDQEWEAAQTVWVWADASPSMLYRSETVEVSKQSRALVLALALIEVLAKSGEKVGWPGVTRAISSRNAAERIAAELVLAKSADGGFPETSQLRNRAHFVMISDFLTPLEETLDRVNRLARDGINGALVQVYDPAEQRFPFTGRTQFRDPETGEQLTYGRAETIRDDYTALFSARSETLARHCKRLGWNFVRHSTGSLASTALVALHMRLTGQGGGFAS